MLFYCPKHEGVDVARTRICSLKNVQPEVIVRLPAYIRRAGRDRRRYYYNLYSILIPKVEIEADCFFYFALRLKL